jgi:mono/diheme cytochrome c family protein
MRLYRAYLWAPLFAALAVPLPALAGDATTGQTLFNQKCSACHQKSGQGIKGAFPALAGNAFVQGDGRAVLHVVLSGRGGMPSFADLLSDIDIAAILSYVRSAWGNTGSSIPAALVTEVKQQTSVAIDHDIGN